MKPIRVSTLGKIVWLLIIFILVIVIACAVSFFKKGKDLPDVEPVSNNEEKIVDYTDTKLTELDFDSNLNIKAQNNVITLTESKTYKFSGTNNKYKIVINAPNKVVKLQLSNFKTSIVDNLIKVENASKLVLNLEENNEIKAFENMENIFHNTSIISSNCDIEIIGSGTLVIDSNNDFLTTKGNFNLSTAVIEVNNIETGLNVKGNTIINGGIFYLNANNNGFICDGNFTLDNGKVIIKATKNPIDITGVFLINKGEILLAGLNEFHKPNANSLQKSLIFNFEQPTDKALVLHDTKEVILAYEGNKEYQHILYSKSELDADGYVLYSGGSIGGKKKYDLYYEIEDYLEDYQLTCPNLTSSMFEALELINIYDGVVKK